MVFRLGKKTTTGSAGDKKADEKALGVDAQGPFLFSRSWAVMQMQELFYCTGKTKAPSPCLAGQIIDYELVKYEFVFPCHYKHIVIYGGMQRISSL